MQKRYLLGIDTGTSLVKAVVFDFQGREIGSGSRKVAVESPHRAWAQQDPDQIWQTTAATIKASLTRADIKGEEIAVVAPAGQGDGVWLLDGEGQPLKPAVLWNDGRAAGVVEHWEKTGLLEKVFARNGTQLWPGASAPILAWLRENDAHCFSKAATIFWCKDWIKFKLTGVVGTDESDGSIPFANLARRRYDDELLGLFGFEDLKAKLAPMAASHEIIGEITAEAAVSTGLQQGTPVVSGMLDVAANAIGAGVISAGQALTIMGTTTLNMVVLGEPSFTPRGVGASTCHAVPRHWMRILGAMTGTPNLDWYLEVMGAAFKTEAQTKGRDLFNLLEAAVQQSAVGAGGVLFHPFLFGERAPFVNPNAKAAFFGIHANTTNQDLLRAIHEGIALSARDCYQKIGTLPSEVTLVGGGSKSQAWCQMLADTVGCRMKVPRGSQFGALGAAMAGGVGIGIFKDYTDAVDRCLKIEKIFEPSRDNQKRYDALYALYAGMIQHMTPFWEESEAALSSWR